MHADELRAVLKTDPFKPFRLRFASGRVVEITNPDLVVVSDTGRSAFAYKPKSNAFDIIDVRLVEALEFRNGAAHRRGKK